MINNQQLLRILVVEDDEDDFILISDYFKNISAWKFEINWIQRYSAAIDELCSNRYTLCFCDYRLGAKNGIDLIKDVVSKNTTTPIILLTGKGNYNIDIEATKAGAFDYLIKADLDEDKLERTIRYTLERIHNLQKIQESERRYRSIFEKSKDIVFIARRDTTLTTINYAVTDILDFAVEDCVGKKLTAFLKNPADMEDFFTKIRMDGEIDNFEMEFITATDEVKTCLISASIEIDSNNEHYLQGIIHDITDLKKAEKASLQAEKLAASGRFIRTLAHEVRNPLSNIKLAVENLLQKTVDEDDHFYLDIIHRNGQRINDLVTELLQSSRPADMNFEDISLHGLLNRVIASVQDKVVLRNIKLITHFDDDDCTIKADAPKLDMAILNILVNAIEAVADQTGLIEVATICQGKQAQLLIIDNGCGISKENKAKLFEPYFTSKRNGIGLGLATTLNILQSHNARIDVQSQEEKGTVFTILFGQ
ncbi:MAG: sensor hybrid histidine kinase [Ferruginibacter sp.]|nr:sensor hybrid histidine kinase [Ferruginibacter sp.]